VVSSLYSDPWSADTVESWFGDEFSVRADGETAHADQPLGIRADPSTGIAPMKVQMLLCQATALPAGRNSATQRPAGWMEQRMRRRVILAARACRSLHLIQTASQAVGSARNSVECSVRDHAPKRSRESVSSAWHRSACLTLANAPHACLDLIGISVCQDGSAVHWIPPLSALTFLC